jgi:hypothetical protein
MLLATLFAIPLWLTIPLYFALGVLWATLYLPRSVQRQARSYSAWKHKVLEGRALAEAIGNSDEQRGYWVSPNQFLQWRGERNFTERALVTGFVLDIAFWPLRILRFLVVDAIRFVFEKLAKCLADFWRLVLVPVLRWIGRVLRNIWTHLIIKPLRYLRRFVRYVWRQVIAPAYRWVYDRVIRVYQSIIQRANREAIADMALLNRAQEEKK